jgi:hypothetical protein
MKKWSWKAILGGLTVDIFGGILIGIPIGIAMVMQAARNGDLSAALAPSQPLLIGSAITGLFMDILGGYLTAMWAPTRKIGHAAIMGCGSLALGLLFRGMDTTPYPTWYALTWVLMLPCALLGGWWRVQKHGPESKPKVQPENGGGSTSAPIASPFGD